VMRKFTKNELEVMKILWEGGDMKPSEIQEKFPIPIKNPALRSHLSFLLEKGHVTRRKHKRAYYYKAKTKKESVFRHMYGNLVDAFFEGSTESLLCHLVKSEKLSKETISELNKLIKSDKRKRGPKK